MKLYQITLIIIGILSLIILPQVLIPKPVQGLGGTTASDIPVDEIPAVPVGAITGVSVAEEPTVTVDRLKFEVSDPSGVVYVGSPGQLDGLIKGVDANINDLQTKRAELVNIQNAVVAEIAKRGLKDPPATTTP